MPGAGSAGRARARGGVFAERVNAAADLLDRAVPTASATRELAERFGCSARQARRYLQRAGRSGRMAVPAPAAVFTVRLPVPLIAPGRARPVREAGRGTGSVERLTPRPGPTSHQLLAQRLRPGCAAAPSGDGVASRPISPWPRHRHDPRAPADRLVPLPLGHPTTITTHPRTYWRAVFAAGRHSAKITGWSAFSFPPGGMTSVAGSSADRAVAGSAHRA